MEIRDECAGDVDAIRRLHFAAFGGEVEGRLVDLLRERGKAIVSIVAVEAGDVVGHVLFSRVTIDGAESARSLPRTQSQSTEADRTAYLRSVSSEVAACPVSVVKGFTMFVVLRMPTTLTSLAAQQAFVRPKAK